MSKTGDSIIPRDDRVVSASGTTQVASPPIGAAGAPSQRVGVVAGSGPPPSVVTDAVRRRRLRAAALFLLCTLVVLLGHSLFIGDRPSQSLNVATIVAMGVCLAVLSSPSIPLALRGLRVLEAAIFGMMAVFLAAQQYESIREATLDRDATELVVSAKMTLIGSMLLIFTYCMLIPNNWRRAARIVPVIAAVPVVTQAAFYLTHPELARFALGVATVERLSENFVIALISGGLGIYGTRVINELRAEVFEARQLNQYRLRDRLGAGGMGEVYLAEHRFLKRPCALKLIRPENAGDPRALARFEREVHATARLSHPNTIDVYDYGHTEDGTFYYVMEYLPGLTLGDLVRRHGPLPPGRVIYLLRQVCGALTEAHASGLIHRDLKPDNIFAARRGGLHDVAKVLDFGLVKAPPDLEGSALSREGWACGSPLYMSPEQALGDRSIDHRCDLYALGGVGYFLLTGRPPFVGDTPARVMIAQAHQPAEPPSHLRPEIPEDLERVILRSLAKPPADRYPDARALGDALAACSSAADWDARKAEAWWQEVERAGPSAPASPTPSEQAVTQSIPARWM